MDTARRFSTPEIEDVFARAAAAQAQQRETDLGLTMEELQAVGAEAGIDPAHVAAAARAVAEGEPDQGRESMLGVPVGVRRSATLEATPSDALWDSIVADLQDTFSARGKTERIGQNQIWHNGNLRATLSPSGDGSRLRIQSNRRKDTRGMLTVAGVNAVLAVVFSLNAFESDDMSPVMLGLIAAAVLVATLVRQVTWTRTRERQMNAVTARAQRTARVLKEPSTTSRPMAPILDLLDLEDNIETDQTARPRGRARV